MLVTDLDEYELLLRHARKWAEAHRRVLDGELIEEAIRLRSVHDGWAANRWPSDSVTHLFLVRWPAHGPLDPPDVPALQTSLETFWRFLRNTGRMAGGSAEPAALVREAKAAGRKMPDACADLANFGPTKQMLAFGREIGISMDDLQNQDDLNDRFQQIQEAWNALPTDERRRRSPGTGNTGSRMANSLTQAANHMQQYGEMPPGWALPEMPRLDQQPDDEPVYPTDPAISAPLYRASPFVQRVLALCEWVGDGREVTATQVLRPAVAEQAYADLDLWDWERAWAKVKDQAYASKQELDEQRAARGFPHWRTAADCLPLDRLWLPAQNAGLITITGKKAVFDRKAMPGTDMGWAHMAQALLAGLAYRAQHLRSFDPLLSILMDIAMGGTPRSVVELKELWWSSPANGLSRRFGGEALARMLSDEQLEGCLVMFEDTGAWTTRRGKLVGTDIGWDLAITAMAAIEHGLLADPGYGVVES